jgi:hypothetical protein
MNRWKKLAVSALAATVGVGAGTVSGAAHADIVNAATLAHGQKGYTLTSPEYVIADENATVVYSPGSTRFIAWVNHRRWWESAYLVTGYSRGNNTANLAGNYGRYDAFRIPAPLTGTNVTAGMTYSGDVTRPGWDLWLAPTRRDGTDTSAAAMERDSRAVEILLQPGRGGFIANPGRPYRQHRAFVGGGALRAENLTRVARYWLRKMRLSPAAYSWQAIPAGFEGYDHGTFRLDSYTLNITTSATYRSTRGYNAYACSGSTWVWRYRAVTTSSTYTQSLKGQSYATAHAMTVADAKGNAVYRARVAAREAAQAAADKAPRKNCAPERSPGKRLPGPAGAIKRKRQPSRSRLTSGSRSARTA